MEPDPAPQAETRTETLPSQLAAQLSAKARDALGHPVRRQILRTLNDSPAPRSPDEIATTALPSIGAGAIGYHARVLEGYGSIAMSGTREVPNGLVRLYDSRVAGDEQVAAVLRATRERDRWTGHPQ